MPKNRALYFRKLKVNIVFNIILALLGLMAKTSESMTNFGEVASKMFKNYMEWAV